MTFLPAIAHDFFNPQPVKDASVFLLKNVIHDWSDTYARRILLNLRNAAAPGTKLLLVESLIEYACRTHTSENSGSSPILGAAPLQAPEPLLANFGDINFMQYMTDISVRSV